MEEFDKVLNENEKVFWQGKPAFWPFFLSVTPISLFGAIFMVAGLFPLYRAIVNQQFFLILFPHFWVGLVVFLGIPIYKALVYSKTAYAITNKRVILQTGLVGRDFNMADFDQITNAEVDVGVLDKLFGNGSGSIHISTAGTFRTGKHGPIAAPYRLSNIAKPYDVFRFFKKVSFDVKTDIDYPNKYRPGTNPGYRSVYKPGK